ncbi:uncharacterized protein LOC112540814 [Python bivittatus]|uniref:Uncharacterized protein LOC112540814 n=1 Tax=Python bivittatus TaxID=176946 RepID=A0A9F5IZ07_PYTBI|nr:uncharacterized protein LOC112540814 [Python bivittatus]
MFELQLLRRPLSPKTEPEQYIPKRKCAKGVREKEEESGKELGDVDSQPPLPEKSQSISLCFPDYDLGIQIPSPLKRNFVIPAYLSGPPSFPMQNRRIPIRLRLPTLKEYSFHLPSDLIVSGVNMVVSSLHSVIPKSVPKKPFISQYNYEVFSSQLIAKEMKGPEKVATIFLTLDKPDRQLPRQEKSRKFMLDEEQIMLDEEKKMRSKEREMRKKSKSYEEVKQEMDLSESFVSGAGYRTECPIDKDNELVEKAKMVVLFCIMHRKTGLSLKVCPQKDKVSISWEYNVMSSSDLEVEEKEAVANSFKA